MPAKFCLFCGDRPEGKSKEHVLPKWLIQLTGDPRRAANFGLDLSREIETAAPRKYAFSQFQFPACRVCNGLFARLEGDAKKVVVKILASEALVVNDLSVLLDWLDKVRIGLWLGFHQLDQNIEGIHPRFYVRDRIGRKDRVLILALRNDDRPLLSFIGPTTVAFRFLPSAFGLVINNLCIVNISYDYLLARRLGFPYPRTPIISTASESSDYCELGRGLHRVIRPVYSGSLPLNGTIFYQPMFSSELSSSTRGLYEAEYVKAHSLNWEGGIGGIYYSRRDQFRWLDTNDEVANITIAPQVESAEKKMVRTVFSSLKYLNIRLAPDHGYRAPKDRAIIGERRRLALRELEALERMARSMPDRRWVQGPHPPLAGSPNTV